MSNHEIFHTKEDKEELRNFEAFKRPMLKFQTENHDSISSGSKSHSQEKEEKEQLQNRIVLSKHSDSESISTPSTREVQHKVEEEDDGFRTPTSLEHQIPEAKQCPPAPRKPKPSLKRKATQTSCSCRHPLDLSKEVAIELLFPTQQHNPFTDSHQTTKKVRIEEP